jgi:uncharacterized protein YjbI with pentapeptide repeats
MINFIYIFLLTTACTIPTFAADTQTVEIADLQKNLADASFVNDNKKVTPQDLRSLNLDASTKVSFTNHDFVKNAFFCGTAKQPKIIRNIDFSGCTLENADFSYCKIINCKFKGANMINANFSNTIIDSTSFKDAKLANAKFNHARITFSTFWGATLTQADYSNSFQESTG